MREPIVVSWGAGDNSTAMVVGLLERGVPPDLVLFADTGGEHARTYRFISEFRAWLEARDVEFEIVRHPGRTLEEECLDGEMLPSLAYGYASCSDKWKRRPLDRRVSTWELALAAWDRGEQVVRAIGYDAGPRDRKRAARANQANSASRRWRLWYPLIEWGWSREECVEAIARAGLSRPGKSACFFCPASKRREVLELRKQEPELFARAIALEKNAKLSSIKGLGRSWSWSTLDVTETAQGKFVFDDDNDERLPCMCDDGH